IYAGNLAIKTSETDYLEGGSHSSSNEKIMFYTVEPRSMGDGISMSDTSATVELSRSSEGWAWISIHNGDDEYLTTPWMESEFKNQNPRVREIYYKDLDNDDKKEMIGKVWFGDIVVSSGQDPSWTLQVSWIDEDVSLTLSSPSDVTGVGEVSGTKDSITWEITDFTAGDGAVFGKIYVATNDTREGEDIRLEGLDLFGDITVKGKNSWSTPAWTSSGDYEGYYFSPTEYTDPFNGILVYRETGATDKLYASLSFKAYLETNNVVTVTLYIELVGGDGSTTQLSDTVNVEE
ncbi:MAG: hypothetical protein ACOC6N_02945, partial [archaeon]